MAIDTRFACAYLVCVGTCREIRREVRTPSLLQRRAILSIDEQQAAVHSHVVDSIIQGIPNRAEKGADEYGWSEQMRMKSSAHVDGFVEKTRQLSVIPEP